jgi:hypothetical protein
MNTSQLPRKRLYLLLTGALLAAAVTAGHAADKPKESSFGKGKATGAFLTKDQLRVCLTQQARLAQQDAAMLKDQAELTAIKAELVRGGSELKEQLAALDRTNQEAVNAYNERSIERDKSIDDYEARVPQFNSRVEAARTEREAFATSCDNRRFFEEDEIAIRKGK